MNRALWAVGLSVTVSFCAVAMDPFEIELKKTDEQEEFYKACTVALNKHFLLQFKIATEREKCAEEEEKARQEKAGLQEKRLPAHPTAIYYAIQLDALVKNGKFKEAVRLIERNKFLMDYSDAPEIIDVNDQVKGVGDGRIKGCFVARLSQKNANKKLLAAIDKAAFEEAHKANNKPYLKARKEAQKNDLIGKEISSDLFQKNPLFMSSNNIKPTIFY